MCFHSKQGKDAQTLETRFNAKFDNSMLFVPTDHYNAFDFPKTPVITNTLVQKIQMYNWGLMPNWTNDLSFRKNTLNAKIETINIKPSFKDSIENRCLILLDGFYEWQWLDVKGKKKQKYLITLPNGEPFALAGLWNIWIDKKTNEKLETYTILTTEANEHMSVIHNSKKRMPVILEKAEEKEWLDNRPIEITRNIKLELIKI